MTLDDHFDSVPAVSITADSPLVASGGWDGTMRLWRAPVSDLVRTLRAEYRFACLDITGLMGITEAQRQGFLALGAAENEIRFSSNRVVNAKRRILDNHEPSDPA